MINDSKTAHKIKSPFVVSGSPVPVVFHKCTDILARNRGSKDIRNVFETILIR